MNWSAIGMMAVGGVWTLLTLMIGIGIGRQPFTTPKDPRGLTQ